MTKFHFRTPADGGDGGVGSQLDARAAVDAIKSKNHSFFKGRNHTGRILWEYGSV